jgi:hypothetical protein
MTTEQEMRIKGIAIGEMMVAVEMSSKEQVTVAPLIGSRAW